MQMYLYKTVPNLSSSQLNRTGRNMVGNEPDMDQTEVISVFDQVNVD